MQTTKILVKYFGGKMKNVVGNKQFKIEILSLHNERSKILNKSRSKTNVNRRKSVSHQGKGLTIHKLSVETKNSETIKMGEENYHNMKKTTHIDLLRGR